MMGSIIERKLVWWRDVPIDVENGLLTYLAKNWKNEIYVICANNYESSRRQCAWDIKSFDHVHVIIGNLDHPDNKRIIDQLLDEDCVNIISGIKGGHRIYLDKLAQKHNGSCVIIMESTSLYGSKIKVALKKIAYPIIYGHYYRKYRAVIKGLFTMGEDAIKLYSSYGWKNIFNFMYLPKLKIANKIVAPNVDAEQEVKMLYIGRFDFATKGVHILMEAIDHIKSSKLWSIDLVGGYGAQKDNVLSWCKEKTHVRFLGSWDAASVVEKMADYDFCIVPSLYDGWNLTPLQAIHAGIGCIITDNAGSQELVRNSGAGVVIKTNDSSMLRECIQEAIENRGLVENWKLNARKYVDRVSIENVGNYFMLGLKYCYGEQEEKPECPW